VRVRVDSITYSLEEEIPLDKNKKHSIEVVVDRLVSAPSMRGRLTDSIETRAKLSATERSSSIASAASPIFFSELLSCPHWRRQLTTS